MTDGLEWFRFYGAAVDDEKLRLLAFEDRWHFVAILCLKSKGVLDSPAPQLERRVAVKMGVQIRELDEIKRRLMEVGLINDQFQPIAWGKRQFRSDHDGADRVRRWRERNKEDRNVTVTSQKRRVNALDTDTDTDTEKNKSADALVLHASLPSETWTEWLAHRREKHWSMSPRALKPQLKLLAKYDTETQREIIETSMQSGWQGLFPPKGKPKPKESQQWM